MILALSVILTSKLWDDPKDDPTFSLEIICCFYCFVAVAKVKVISIKPKRPKFVSAELPWTTPEYDTIKYRVKILETYKVGDIH